MAQGWIRSGWTTMVLFLAVTVTALACAGSAFANRVFYSSEAQDLGVYFELSGKNCPHGPHCFDHARLPTFNGYWEQFPNCPEVNLSGGFEFGSFGNLHGTPVRVNKRRRFHGEGGSVNYPGDHVTFRGRFLKKNPARAKGWFRMVETNGGESCDTGRVYWIAKVSN